MGRVRGNAFVISRDVVSLPSPLGRKSEQRTLITAGPRTGVGEGAMP